jgi:hypothetical protein
MAGAISRAGLVATSLLGLTLWVGPAEAVQYKLEVANLWETALANYANTAELYDGASGPGLDRLETSLDKGETPKAVTLPDRTLRWAGDTVARAYGTVKVLAEIKAAGSEGRRWDEVTWEGRPGDRSVWVVAPSGRGRPQQMYRVVLKGDGPLRQFTPYVPTNGYKSPAVKYPLNFLWFYEERGGVWDKYVSQTMDLGQGLGAVVGENPDQMFPDQVYLIVQQGAQPTTYKAVLLWRDAYSFEGPGNFRIRIK